MKACICSTELIITKIFLFITLHILETVLKSIGIHLSLSLMLCAEESPEFIGCGATLNMKKLQVRNDAVNELSHCCFSLVILIQLVLCFFQLLILLLLIILLCLCLCLGLRTCFGLCQIISTRLREK